MNAAQHITEFKHTARRSALVCCLGLITSLTALPGLAAEGSAEPMPPGASQLFDNQAQRISAKQAAAIARKEMEGRVLSVKPMLDKGAGYRVNMLLDGGRVVTVKVDPHGRIRR